MFLTRELAKRGKLVLLSPNAGQAWFNGELVLQLASYDWPGNVRQLGLTIGRIVACSSSLPRAQLDPETERVLDASRTEAARLDPTHALPRESGTTKLTDEAIVDSHERLGGYVGKTAESLGIRKERVRQALQRQGKPTSTTLSYLEANRLLKVHGTEREAARSLGMDVRAFSVALRKLDRSDDKEA
jgi:transcriptional regulator with PAS, ATPase and Fis domain